MTDLEKERISKLLNSKKGKEVLAEIKKSAEEKFPKKKVRRKINLDYFDI